MLNRLENHHKLYLSATNNPIRTICLFTVDKPNDQELQIVAIISIINAYNDKSQYSSKHGEI